MIAWAGRRWGGGGRRRWGVVEEVEGSEEVGIEKKVGETEEVGAGQR